MLVGEWRRELGKGRRPGPSEQGPPTVHDAQSPGATRGRMELTPSWGWGGLGYLSAYSPVHWFMDALHVNSGQIWCASGQAMPGPTVGRSWHAGTVNGAGTWIPSISSTRSVLETQTSDLLDQNLHFNKIPGHLRDTFEFEKR